MQLEHAIKSPFLRLGYQVGPFCSVCLTDIQCATHRQKDKVFDPAQRQAHIKALQDPIVRTGSQEQRLDGEEGKVSSASAMVLKHSQPTLLPDPHEPLFAEGGIAASLNPKPEPSLPVIFEQVSGNAVQLRDPRLPQFEIHGHEQFRAKILEDLGQLLTVPSTRDFFAELRAEAEQSGKTLQICSGPSSRVDCAELESNNIIKIAISEGETWVICIDKDNNYVLEYMSSALLLAHEATHVYHILTDTDASHIDDTDGFDDREERNTIGTTKDVHTQQFTENAYRGAFGLNLRVGHYGIGQDTPFEEEKKKALRYSIAEGQPFAFLNYNEELLDNVYGTEGVQGEERTKRVSHLQADKNKLLEHTKSRDPQKVEFAITMLRQLDRYVTAPFAKRQLQKAITDAYSHLKTLV